MRIRGTIVACALSAITASCGQKETRASSVKESEEVFELCEGQAKPGKRYVVLKIENGKKVKVGMVKGRALVKVYEDKVKRDLDQELKNSTEGALYAETFDYIDQTEKSRQLFGGELDKELTPSLRGPWFLMTTFSSGVKRITNLELRWNQKDEAHVTFAGLNCRVLGN